MFEINKVSKRFNIIAEVYPYGNHGSHRINIRYYEFTIHGLAVWCREYVNSSPRLESLDVADYHPSNSQPDRVKHINATKARVVLPRIERMLKSILTDMKAGDFSLDKTGADKLTRHIN